ncbi:MAG: MalY/PatB family protein [Corynebacterium sp.]|uniref:MalY/PatB family protein n=1 Tax=Corynebacterium sp. CNJ-954 TaxID=1904962 RepID=UPI00095D7318|nr:MalY/PatB family protein [Corynebacterium sp. CNJ-954]OLT53688.1 aspartate aminotransferase [Corynebacterium sp. CNJ-954]
MSCYERTDQFFDSPVDRKNTQSLKWSHDDFDSTNTPLPSDVLPMWVADMDFRSPRPVLEALHERIDHGVFGYPSAPSKEYFDAISNWQGERFGWDIPRDWIIPTAGVITALKTAVQAFSSPGDSVLIQPPVYSHFHDDILVNGRHLAYAPLARNGDRYVFDPGVFEAAITPSTRIFILSNPHNPTGNVWSEEELRLMGEICLKNDVLVISDEVHQDFILVPEKKHIPFASLDHRIAARSITCTAPSKTFNLAGLQCSNVFIPDRFLREEFARQYTRNLYPRVNALGTVAAEAAYRHGAKWLKSLLEYIVVNRSSFADSINDSDSPLHVLPSDSLYLAWIDCRELGLSPEELHHFMLREAGLWLDAGTKFGIEGEGYMRINLGCPRSTVDAAVSRLLDATSA